MGRSVVQYYVFLTYIPQLVIYIFFPGIYTERYILNDLGVWLLAGMCLFVLAALKVRWSDRRFHIPIYHLPRFFQWAIVFAFLAVAGAFFAQYGTNFRHANRVSEAGGLIYLLYVLKPIVVYFLYRYVLIVASGERLIFQEKVMIFIGLVGLVLSATGSFSILGVMVAAVLITPARRLLQLNIKMASLIKFLPVAILIPFAVSMYGLSLKIGFEAAKEIYMYRSSELLGDLILRGSVSFASAANRVETLLIAGTDFSPIVGQVKTLIFRLGFLSDVGNGGEYLVNINRMNYEAINKLPDLERAGASPGLVGSFMFLPNFFVGIVFLVIYVKFITSMLDRLSFAGLNKKPFVILATLFSIMPLFESPLAALTILDPVFVTLAIFLFGLFFRIR